MGLFAIVFLFAASSDVSADTPVPKPARAAEVAAPRQTRADDAPLYTVVEGNKVDERTLQGWKTWRALACERCHGAEQEGLVGPPLVESMKQLTKEEFHTTIMNGRPEKGMPPFSASPTVTKNWEGLYAYLKGRSDGRIKPGRLTAIDEK
jgi:mono/diheme cytochrome c family protein